MRIGGPCWDNGSKAQQQGGESGKAIGLAANDGHPIEGLPCGRHDTQKHRQHRHQQEGIGHQPEEAKGTQPATRRTWKAT